MLGGTEIDAQIIADWRVFFGMAAGTAAGLAGLVFVALSLHLKGIRAHPPYRYRAGSSLSSMMVIFIVSSLVLFPRQTSAWLGLEELVVIGAEGAFLTWNFLRTREAVAKLPQGLTLLLPYQIRTTLAVALCLFGAAGGALVLAGQEAGFYILATFSAVTMVWVVINTWALVIGITDEDGSSGSSEAK
ncbi:MAG TPA: hypothetical protein VF914_05785 [Chloroflexia bacterium]|jgi:hypothetical protein